MAPHIPETESEDAELGEEISSSVSYRTGIETGGPGVSISSAGVVSWRDDSPDHPRNWTTARKFYDITVVAMLEFVTTVVSTTGPSAAASAQEEYQVGPVAALIAFSLMYQLGQAFGGLTVPPCSEVFGRRMPYIFSGVVFALFCLLIGIVPSLKVVYLGRFVTGFASAVPSVVLAGSVEDLFNSRWRVWLVLLWNSLATAGLIFGPVFGVHISFYLGWRWVYYIAAIVTASLTVLTLFIRESRPSLLLARKVATLSKHSGREFTFENHDAIADRTELLNLILIRPASLLATEPIMVLATGILAVSWAIIYLFTEALVGIYETMGFSRTSASLSFLAIGVGVLFSVFPRIQDMRIARKRSLCGAPLEPEDKLTGFVFAVVSLAIGLWWFAWSIPPAITGAPWIVPTLGLIFVGFAVNEIAYTLSSYLADSYTTFAASAFAGLAFVRAVISGVMPLIAFAMYSKISANFATTVVAVVATLFGIAPYILLKYSKTLRGLSPFARYSLRVHERTRVEVD